MTKRCSVGSNWDAHQPQRLPSDFIFEVLTAVKMDPEDGDDTFLRNVDNHLQDYKASQPRGPHLKPSDC
jgi:hypothetical protein